MDRDIDKLMASKVLGHTLYYEKNGAIRERLASGQTRPLRPYATDIAAAWEVVQKLGVALLPTSEGWFALIGESHAWRSPAEFMAYLQKGDFVRAGAAVAPQASTAVCLAAVRWLDNVASRDAGQMDKAADRIISAHDETSAPQSV